MYQQFIKYYVHARDTQHTKIGSKYVKTACFLIKTSCFFAENNMNSLSRSGCGRRGDPGVEEAQTRVPAQPGWGCGAVYPPCFGKLCALFGILIR